MRFKIQDSRFKKRIGFTLIELMISISIIAILSVVMSLSFSRAQKSGRDQRRVEDLKAIQNAAEQYYLLSGAYPATNLYDPNDNWTVNGQVILQVFPSDPKSTSYIKNSSGTTGYCICAKVENYKNGNSEGGNCTFGIAAVNNCELAPDNCYFCVKNQQ